MSWEIWCPDGRETITNGTKVALFAPDYCPPTYKSGMKATLTLTLALALTLDAISSPVSLKIISQSISA